MGKGGFLIRGDLGPPEYVALEICYFYGVQNFLQAISVNERSKSDGPDKFPEKDHPVV